MYDFIKGKIVEVMPTYVVVENNGIGYRLQISLQTFTDIQSLSDVKLYIYHHIREDQELWFGFYGSQEREIFLLLIGISGIGPNMARTILSSMTFEELREAILTGNESRIKSIKGVGLKTAQRIIIELQDKIAKGGVSDGFSTAALSFNNPQKEEAIAALLVLGFPKNQSEKAVNTVFKEHPESKVDELIKLAMRQLL
ncbi:MAG: Holliday junction branch migration protein RuvA [Bacteroidetes bacterium]|uniref:Holliday junction branch migration complex subunit RuvA n=1 Tax=Candidatus Egerieousia excrementavium TaxID=2840778 RepID=A0A9D9DMV5_9BACT|nr:Holliday junction branch migration protein RuvA [Candidatus Egerieousia excrementavium]